METFATPRVRRLHPCTHRVTFKARKEGGSREGKAQVSWGMDAVSVRPYLSRDCRMLKERPLPPLLLSRLQVVDIPQDPTVSSSVQSHSLSQQEARTLSLSDIKTKDHPADLQTHFKVHLTARL